MSQPILKVKKSEFSSQLKYAKPGDVGLDLRAYLPNGAVVLPPLGRMIIKSDISVAIPEGHEATVRPRSGQASKVGLVPSVGTVDTLYRGDVGIICFNLSNDNLIINHGDRIAQLVISPVTICQVVEVDELDETERGSTGFGSTGTK